MASSPRGLRLLKALDFIKSKSSFDATTVIAKTNIASASNGVLKGTFKIEPAMCNIGGTLHGGYISSVVDVFSFYSQLSNPDGRMSWTTTISVNFLGSALEGETVNVETKSLIGGNSSVVETYFHNCKGKLIAKGTATFITGGEKYQQFLKECCGFDVYDNSE